jgi:hypothetical protein
LEINITVRVYDSGIVHVNQNRTNGPAKQLHALRFIAQMLEELFDSAAARLERKDIGSTAE